MPNAILAKCDAAIALFKADHDAAIGGKPTHIGDWRCIISRDETTAEVRFRSSLIARITL